MFRRVVHRRFAFWVVAFALLLKSAMPMLASAAADAQGRTLVEVCTAYGVATVELDADGHPMPAGDSHDGSSAHGGSHCVLSGLTAYAQPPAHAGIACPLCPPTQAPPAAFAPTPPDADATWVARLKHGPPDLS